MKADVDTAVVMACDANYAPYAFFLAQQISKLHPDRRFDICIFSQDLLEMPEGLSGAEIKLERIPGESPFRNGPNPSRHGDAAYLRLLIPPLVIDRYKRLLYVDSDIFLSGPGIGRLLAVDMLGAPIAAVRDNTQWRTPRRLLPEFKALGWRSMPYFNSGVLLIDVARYQSERILEQCVQMLHAHPEALPRHDQSLLNLVMKGRWTELSPVWNWQYTWSSRFFADLADPRLIHFIGARKPWKDTRNALPARYRSAYTSFVQAHYPLNNQLALVEATAQAWPDSLWRMFLKHLLSVVPMKRYLTRFSHDLVRYRPHEGGSVFGGSMESGMEPLRHLTD